ncbi:hypothetical protein BN1058_01082 [Paraliobacillus sp. PM-2]|uniref:hypothetical protein n=1 Tax=Paraliobacillus sp. PM-2 TaxID=1462524 RepID=UPI00061CCB7F|nr:hypothetical protein [Paraliobacillus sp. PM-2]CQR46807.1 hypothetical protein BN1058_01082 [Paraliobacillus sp. PM-2]
MLLNIPIRFAGGVHTVGISSLFLFIVGIFLLVKSLNNYHGRIVLIVILIFNFTPEFVVNSYQKNFATGIYAVSYENEQSNCSFEMISEKTLHGECVLPFYNYSNNDVQFTVTFVERHLHKYDLPMVSLMNKDGPYEVTLGAKESNDVHVETNINVSNMKNHIENGQAMGVNIIIKAKGKSRNL